MLSTKILIAGLVGSMSISSASVFAQVGSDQEMGGTSPGADQPSSFETDRNTGMGATTEFDNADVNRDGALDEGEARISGIDTNTMDTDDDGYITREEYERNS